MGTHRMGTMELKTMGVRFGIYKSCYLKQISMTTAIQLLG